MYTVGNDISQFTHFGKYYLLSMLFRLLNFKKFWAKDQHDKVKYRLWIFQAGCTKLKRFLPKNQHTQRKFLNFENWTNEEPQ